MGRLKEEEAAASEATGRKAEICKMPRIRGTEGWTQGDEAVGELFLTRTSFVPITQLLDGASLRPHSPTAALSASSSVI